MIRCRLNDQSRLLRADTHEGGYALITTIWFILLGTAIVSSLMLLAIKRSEAISAHEKAIMQNLAQESVIETVAADIIFNGPRSEWAILPHQAVYDIDGQRFNVSMDSEAGKLDINAADPQLIERALQGLGVARQDRQLLLADIAQRRQQGRAFRSLIEWNFPLSALPEGQCPERYFTIASGLARPSPQFLDPQLARSLAIPATAGGGRLQLGSAVMMRVKSVTASKGQGYLLRISGTNEKAFAILDVVSASGC